MDFLNNETFEDLVKSLERQFPSQVPAGYIRIALGDAETKLTLEETQSGAQYPANERKGRLRVIAKNIILDELRRQQKLEHYQKNPAAFEKDLFDGGFEKREEDKLLVQEMLLMLPRKKREALKLWIGGYTVDQIADDLCVTPDAIKRRLKEAKKKLRRIFRKGDNK